jgi:hypothetical protein
MPKSPIVTGLTEQGDQQKLNETVRMAFKAHTLLLLLYSIPRSIGRNIVLSLKFCLRISFLEFRI